MSRTDMSCITEEINGDSILEMAMGNAMSEILLLSVTLNIYDFLEEPLTSTQLANKLNIPALHVGAFLDACCTMKLLDKTVDEIKPDFKYGTYQNNRLSSALLRDVGEHSMKALVLSGISCIKANIDVSAKAIMTGHKSNSMYKLLEENKEMRIIFHEYMKEISKTVEEMTRVFDLSVYTNICDLGGSTGQLARMLLKDYPEVNLTVLELEEVTKLAKHQSENLDLNINFVVGSFFSALPASNLYVLSHVLHNWSDEECIQILDNVYRHLPKGGAVLILEGVLNDDRVGPLKFNLSGMVQLDGHTGHHRTRLEYLTMLDRCRFVNAAYERSRGAGYYDALIGTKST